MARGKRNLQNQPSKQQKAELRQLLVESFEQYSGPIPHPQVMKDYQEISPDIVERILTMAEEESNSRRLLEERVIENSHKQIVGGQRGALILGISGLAAAVAIAYFNPSWGGAVGISAIASLIISLVVKRRNDYSHNNNGISE
ncbi:MAG: DUF2335 domain-containing protein [Candidatus Poribacteria bacterium]|nr:DUF2335 domain-containing protein [Candidatus Poribacteria bacterium]